MTDTATIEKNVLSRIAGLSPQECRLLLVLLAKDASVETLADIEAALKRPEFNTVANTALT